MKRARHIRYRRHRVSPLSLPPLPSLSSRYAVQTSIDSFKELFESKARTILLETVYFCVQQIQYFEMFHLDGECDYDCVWMAMV